MPDLPLHPAAREPAALLAECDVQRTRRSGPGGQHRNKTETAVVLQHLPTGVRAEASERRSQAQNLEVALARLRVNLALELRLPLEADSSASPLWQSRCRSGRIVVNPDHADFPALLAEALDVLAARALDFKSAAEFLGTTASQLTRFLKLEPRAFSQVNSGRKEVGLHPLK
jgi:hypothetical protein